MKKQELIEKWESAIESAEFYGKGKEDRLIEYMRSFVSDLNQLDEPEVLSQEWIDDNKEMYLINDTSENAVPDYKLQNLLVPKQELPVIPKFVAEWYESEGKRNSWWNWFYKWGRDEGRTELETKTIRWMQDYNEEAFVNMFLHGYEVEEEPQYIIKTGDERYLSQLALNYVNNPPVTTVHHMKEMAIRFSDRELAHKVADLVNNGEVEELEE